MENDLVQLVSENEIIIDRCSDFDVALTEVMDAFSDVHPHDKVAILEATKTALLLGTMVDIE